MNEILQFLATLLLAVLLAVTTFGALKYYEYKNGLGNDEFRSAAILLFTCAVLVVARTILENTAP